MAATSAIVPSVLSGRNDEGLVPPRASLAAASREPVSRASPASAREVSVVSPVVLGGAASSTGSSVLTACLGGSGGVVVVVESGSILVGKITAGRVVVARRAAVVEVRPEG